MWFFFFFNTYFVHVTSTQTKSICKWLRDSSYDFFFFALIGEELNILPINVIIKKSRDINVDGNERQRETKTYTPSYLLMLTGLQKTALQWSCCSLIRCCKRLAKLIGLTWFYWTCWLSLLILWLPYLKSHWLFQQLPTVSPSYHFMLVS